MTLSSVSIHKAKRDWEGEYLLTYFVFKKDSPMRDGAKQGFPDWIWKLPTLAASYRLKIVWKSLLSSIFNQINWMDVLNTYMTADITAMWSMVCKMFCENIE